MNIFSGNVLQRIRAAVLPKPRQVRVAKDAGTLSVESFQRKYRRISRGPVEDQFTGYFRTGGGCFRRRHV